MDRVPLDSGKSVLLSDPYKPTRAMLSDFKGRDAELKTVFASWLGSDRHPPLCPLLVGEPGVGKNRLVYELAAITGLDLYMLQGHEDITAEDLACSVRFADAAERSMDYVLSPLVTAMHRGGICFIDEIGKIRPRALSLLVSVLDERRYIDSTLLGERVMAKETFRFVAATNTGEENDLPEFIRSRLQPTVRVGFPTKEDIENIIATQARADGHRAVLLETFWGLWRGRALPPTPRDVIQLIALAASLGSFRNSVGKSVLGEANAPDYELARAAIFGGGDTVIDTQSLEEAFVRLFGEEAA